MSLTLEERMTGELRGVEEYIILEPDARLHERWPEADFETTAATLERMIQMTRRGATDGRSLAGLSSVQVLLPGRAVTALDYGRGDVLGFIDPVIVDRSDETWLAKEGCFSLEFGRFYTVSRPKWISVEHTYIDGVSRIRTNLSNYTARFAHHEIDHINGILINEIAEDAAEAEVAA